LIVSLNASVAREVSKGLSKALVNRSAKALAIVLASRLSVYEIGSTINPANKPTKKQRIGKKGK